MKKSIFLGTGAAELIPDPFCKCDVCEYARLHPDEQRGRSAFLYDESTCIDFGPDIFMNAAKFNVNLSNLTDILITHTHGDHLSLENLNVIGCNIPKANHMFTLHMSVPAFNWIKNYCNALTTSSNGYSNELRNVQRGYFDVEVHNPYENFTVGNKVIFPVYGYHFAAPGETAFNYRITENGKTLLYALDTGVYTDETVEALSHFPVDVLIMDATFGSKKMDETCTHLDAYTFVSQLERLYKNGIVTSSTKVFASHINHFNLWHHENYEKFLKENCIIDTTLARDGMTFEW